MRSAEELSKLAVERQTQIQRDLHKAQQDAWEQFQQVWGPKLTMAADQGKREYRINAQLEHRLFFKQKLVELHYSVFLSDMDDDDDWILIQW